MKKMFVAICAIICAGSLFAEDFKSYVPSFWTKEKIEAAIATKQPNLIAKANFFKAVNENPKILTDYSLFSKTCEGLQNQYLKNTNQPKFQAKTAYFVPTIDKNIVSQIYEKYANSSNNDKITSYFVKSNFIKITHKMNDVNYQKMFDDNFNIIKYNSKIYGVRTLFSFLTRNQFNFKTNELKENLQKLNRIVYPKFNEGQDWKKLAVEIKLMLQSLE